jgi:thymidylate synthase|tara:strand:- start:6558 stop:7277 length:720 start_codon:yes stop_codon:yes gene_type:complete
MEIKGQTVDDVLYKTCKKLVEAPEYSPRGKRTKELIQPTLIVEDVTQNIVKNPARKLSMDYLNTEMEWYLSGDLSIDKIGKSASLWKEIADEYGNVNSNYGYLVWKQKLEKYDASQFDWVVNSLLDDKDSRQAVINFNQPRHKEDGVKDFVCTINTQHLIRDNKLIGITNMRSNDLIYGFCYDFPFFSVLQQNIFKQLRLKYNDLKLGHNIHTSASLHVYERHFQMIEDIINEYKKTST